MLFSSITFLFYFLPAVLVLYFMVPAKGKNLVLLIFSLLFYGWGEPVYIFLMVASITQGYFLGRLIQKYRKTPLAGVFLWLSVGISLGLLGFFKYWNFLAGSLNQLGLIRIPLVGVSLPIGISFYTFQILSYVVDVYREKVEAQKSYLRLAVYISMFPQLIAGPIVRYSDIEPQLAHRTHTWEDASYGASRFVLGLSKKVLLANTLGELTQMFRDSAEKSVAFFWLYALACALQIYFDFSGYSDMAIGLGRIFGFRFLENFRYPFISGSVTEFWRRWHISLGSWFRDYLYIPLGGSRVSRGRWVLNILVVWLATGLWHGAQWNFVAWGLFFGVLLAAEKLLFLSRLERHPAVGRIYLLLIVAFTFVMFDSAGIMEGLSRIGGMLGLGGYPLITRETLYAFRSYGLILILACLGSTPLPARLAQKTEEKLPRVVGMVQPVALVALLAGCTAFLVDGSFNPFLYFRF